MWTLVESKRSSKNRKSSKEVKTNTKSSEEVGSNTKSSKEVPFTMKSSKEVSDTKKSSKEVPQLCCEQDIYRTPTKEPRRKTRPPAQAIVYADSKNYAKSKNKARHCTESQLKDAQRRLRYVSDKNAKLIRQLQQQLQYEGLMDWTMPSIVEDARIREFQAKEQRSIYARNRSLKNIRDKVEKSLKNVNNVLSDKRQEEVMCVFIRVTGFLAGLSKCETVEQLVTTTISTLSQHVTPEHVSFMTDLFTSMFETACGKVKDRKPSDEDKTPSADNEDAPLAMESFSEDLGYIRTKLQNFQCLTSSIGDLPFYEVLSKALLLLVFFGYKPSSYMVQEDLVKTMFTEWEDREAKGFGILSIVDAFLAITCFSLEILETVASGGSLRELLLPSTLHSEYAALTAKKASFLSGDLKESHAEYLASVVSLSKKVGIHLKKGSNSPQQKSVYTAYLKGVLELVDLIQSKDKSHELRPAPYAIVLHSGSNIGKTGMMDDLVSMWSAVTGETVRPEHMYYHDPNSEFMNGYDNIVKCMIWDDIANKKYANAADSPVCQFLFWVNNQPSQMTQAAVEAKGRVWANMLLVVASTNVKNIGMQEVSKVPQAVARRIHFWDCRVKKKFAKSNGHLDRSKIEYDEGNIQKPTHEMRPYYYSMKQAKDGSITEHPGSKTEPWQCTSVAFPIIAKDMKKHYIEQKAYIAQRLAAKAAPRCAECGQPKTSSWCKCKELKLEGILDGVSQTALSTVFPYLQALAGLSLPSFGAYFEYLCLLSTLIGACRLFSLWKKTDTSGRVGIAVVLHFVYILVLQYFSSCLPLLIVLLAVAYHAVAGAARYAMSVIRHDIENAIRNRAPCPFKTTKYAMVMAGAIALKFFFRTYQALQPEGLLSPENMDEVQKRRAAHNDWLTPSVMKMEADVPLASMTLQAVVSEVTNNCVFVSSVKCRAATCGFQMDSTTLMIPAHIAPSFGEAPFVRVTRTPGSTSTSADVHLLYPTVIRRGEKEMDFVLFQMSKVLVVKPAIKYFSDETPIDSDCTMISKKGGRTLRRLMWRNSPVTITGNTTMPGSNHKVDIATGKGDCNSPIISNTPPHHIYGFHCAGRSKGNLPNSSIVCAAYGIRRSDIVEAMETCKNAVLPGGLELESIFGDFVGPWDRSPFGEKILDPSPVIHDRAAINFLEYDDADPPMVHVLGYDPRYNARPVSRVQETQISPILSKNGWPCKNGKPALRADRVHSEYLGIFAKGMRSIDPRLLHHAALDYLSPIVEKISEISYPPQTVLPLNSALNGIKGARYIKRINEITSAGIGLLGKKVDHMEVTYPNGVKTFELKDYMLEEFDKMGERLRSGKLVSPLVKTSLKDEFAKKPEYNNGKEKVRLFSVYPFAFFLWGKCLFGQVIEFLYSFPLLCEMTQGINVTTSEWGELHDHLMEWDDKVLEGDFSKFDARISGQLIRMAGSILVAIARGLGYPPEIVGMMKVYLADLATTTWVFNGSVFIIDGVNPSGNWLTIILNGIINVLLHRCAFFTVASERSMGNISFREAFRLGTCGDDSLGTSRFSWFSMREMQEFCASLNMKYTDAQKSLVSNRYSSEPPSLCQRKFRFDEKYAIWHSPLNIDSIGKSLHCRFDTFTSHETLMVQQADAALIELARHSRDVFDKYSRIIMVSMAQLGLDIMMLRGTWTYDQWQEWLYLRYFAGERGQLDEEQEVDYSGYELQAEENFCEDCYLGPFEGPFEESEFPVCGGSDVLSISYWLGVCPIDTYLDVAIYLFVVPTILNYWYIFHGCMNPFVYLAITFGPAILTNLSYRLMYWPGCILILPRLSSVVGSLINPSRITGRRCTFLQNKFLAIGVITTLAFISVQEAHSVAVERPARSLFHSDTCELNSWMTTLHQQKEQESTNVLSFADNAQGWLAKMSSFRESTTRQADTNDTNDGVFKRPIKIFETRWEVGQTLHETFDPWSRYCENPVVANRLAHFKNLRATIQLKFVLDGGPFYYGRLIAAYQPLPEIDNVSAFRSGYTSDYIQASQRLHVYLNPTDCQGGSIRAPFIWPKNTLDISTSEWDQMGDITLSSINNLQHVNGGNDGITVTCFAFSDDLEFDTPTSAVVGDLELQGDDEYGIVSAPAHTVSNIAGKLSDVPYIGPFARATSLASKAVGSVAQIFGFSRAVMDPEMRVIKFHSDFATTNSRDTCARLSVDGKKEVTIDPRVTGTDGADEMALVPMAKRESFLDTFVWDQGFAPETLLWNGRVSPVQGQNAIEFGAGRQEYCIPPMSWVALPFRMWKGTITYRFQIVASAFHRGRIRVVWDPNFIRDADEYNVAYSQIIDIADQKEFSVEVGWGQGTNYLTVGGIDQIPHHTDLQPYTNVSPNANGVLAVYVLNSLASPTDDAGPVSVNVFVKANDDFEVAVPTDDVIQNYKPATDFDPLPDSDGGGNTGGGNEFDDVLLKTGFPNAIISGRTVEIGRSIVSPQWSNFSSFTSRQLWANGVHVLDVYSEGVTGGGAHDITFLLENATSDATDINIVTRNEGIIVSETRTLPASIGGQVSLTIPVNAVQGPNKHEIEVTVGGGSRVWVVSVTTQLRRTVEMDGVMDVDDILAIPTTGINTWAPFGPPTNRRASATQNSDIPLTLPFDYLLDSQFQVACRTGFSIDDGTGEQRFITGAIANSTNAILFPFTSSIRNPTAADTPEIYRIFYLRTTVLEADDDFAPMEEGNAPVEQEETTISMGPTDMYGRVNQVYFGEYCASWRQLLRRYSEKFTVNRIGGSAQVTMTLPHYPNFPTIPTDPTPQGNTFIIEQSTLYNWVSVAYVAQRGGMRWKVYRGTSTASFRPGGLTVTRLGQGDNLGFDLLSPDDLPPIGHSGGAYTDLTISGVMEVECPWYSQFRFQPSRNTRLQDIPQYINQDFYGWTFSPAGNGRLHYAVSTGEDYSLTWFLSTPVVIPV